MDGRKVLKPRELDAMTGLGTVEVGGVLAPLTSDWAARAEICRDVVVPSKLVNPENNTRFGSELAIFHDGEGSGLELSQVAVDEPDAQAPFAILVTVSAFSGTFLSLAVDLPSAALANLRRRHIISCNLNVQSDLSSEVYARLNVRNGQNTEQLTSGITLGEADVVEFDLFHTEMDETQVDAAWLDLIFAAPHVGVARVQELILSRRPRAGF
jgi:hypothetical protein